MNKIQSIRGMNDLLPGSSAVWRAVETVIEELLARYAYREIRFPIVEKTELFRRTIGDVTDIVEKEMYTFDDRNGDSLSLRPEGTAGCVRACLQHGLLDQPRKLWYSGPMFRHERPQKGRVRQFHQFGAEIFGIEGAQADAEMLVMLDRLWRELGVAEQVRLELNSLGSGESRRAHRAALVAYLRDHHDALDEDSVRRLETNPLRILDTKNPDMQELVEGAPQLAEYLDDASREHFAALCAALDAAGVGYRVNPRLVRGLDYYSRTVFEWVTDALGAQGTVCGGGRYDALVEQLGGKPVPALGFGLGMERLVLLVEALGAPLTAVVDAPDLYLLGEPDLGSELLTLAEKLREELPHLVVAMDLGGGSFKSQFKRADRSGAAIALVLGEQEQREGSVVLKFLREQREQETIPGAELVERLLTL